MPDRRTLFWQAVQRRASKYTPDAAAAFLIGVEVLKAELKDAEVDALLALGSVEAAVASVLTDERVAQAFTRFRAQTQQVTRDAVTWFGKDIPGVDPKIGVAFDTLNPRVLDAVRRLDLDRMRGIAAEAREAVRTTVRLGIEAGVNPRETARSLRSVLGLGAKQAEAVANYEAALRGGPRAVVSKGALGYDLRDKRFDGTVKRAIREKERLGEPQIQKMVDAYRRRMVAFNAETNARTATLDSLKLGQQLSWQDAIDKGFVPGGNLMKQWKGVMDDREREEHVAMEGETVPFDQPYSNGEMVPGESTYNCRCVSIVFVGRG